MGIQKYRFDREGAPWPNGSYPIWTDWMYGPTLAGIKYCQCPDGKSRTVYISGEADTFYTVPAKIRYKNKTYKGFVTFDENGYEFNSLEFCEALGIK